VGPQAVALRPVEAVANRTARYVGLRNRDINPKLAAAAAGNGHGPWRFSRTRVMNLALPEAYLASLGLPSLAARR